MKDKEALKIAVACLAEIADNLMCDEDNDEPCGTRDSDPRPGEYCNPCNARIDALIALEKITGKTDERLQRFRDQVMLGDEA